MNPKSSLQSLPHLKGLGGHCGHVVTIGFSGEDSAHHTDTAYGNMEMCQYRKGRNALAATWAAQKQGVFLLIHGLSPAAKKVMVHSRASTNICWMNECRGRKRLRGLAAHSPEFCPFSMLVALVLGLHSVPQAPNLLFPLFLFLMLAQDYTSLWQQEF